jgi:site-specific DNA-methyltransferase (adenine-specific)
MIELIKGDCLEEMQKLIDRGVKVDAVITDPPYGITNCNWDIQISFKKMWECVEGIRNENTTVALFGSEPMASKLRMSNLKNYKYDWIWHKNRPTGIFHVDKRPMKQHEIICIFYKGYYNPVKEMYSGKYKYQQFRRNYNSDLYGSHFNFKYKKETIESTLKYPGSVQYFCIENKPLHPTQKPIKLMEYFVRTYTKPGETVLDFTMGSGTTGVACKRLHRNFIGIELNQEYFEIAKDRIDQTIYEPQLFEEEREIAPQVEKQHGLFD